MGIIADLPRQGVIQLPILLQIVVIVVCWPDPRWLGSPFSCSSRIGFADDQMSQAN